LEFFVAFEDTVINGIHPFQHVGLKILLAALAADTSGHITYNHQMFFTAIVVFDDSLDHLSPTIAAVRLAVHDRPPLVLGSIHFGTVGV
jgi:hypothetical protein